MFSGNSESATSEPDKRHRTPKMEKLEGAVAGMYIMTGGALSTLPAQFAPNQIKMVGVSLAKSCDEIAEAWIDLAEDDKRVLKALESLTSFSGWGKIVGVHLMAIGSVAMPGVMGAMPQPTPQQQGTPDEANIQNAMIIADMIRQAQSQQRAEPVFEQQQQQQQQQRQPQRAEQQPPPVRQAGPVSTRPGRNAGIPSAADLGVSIPDAPAEFPTAGADNIRG